MSNSEMFCYFSVLSCRSLRDLYFDLYDMNDTCITMQKNNHHRASLVPVAAREGWSQAESQSPEFDGEIINGAMVLVVAKRLL